MKAISKWATAASAAAVLAVQAIGQQAVEIPTAPVEPTSPKRVIVVSLEDKKLALIEDGKVEKIYTVAIGKPSTPSPVGTFAIARRVKNPTYSHNGKTIQPGPSNPVGTRWMGLNLKGYGIHGTNEPNSIGKAASHGCIRMAKKDLEEIYAMVSVGDTVELVGERNQETAQLFDPQKPAAATQEVVTASAASVPSTPAVEAPSDAAVVTANQ
jgi:lipoprotein-anchoring transpeptidase ErfK/SrfK